MTRPLDGVVVLADPVRERVASARDGGATKWFVPAYFFVLSLVVLFPLLRPGYVLSLDMVFSPNMRYAEYILRAKDPLYYGRLPIALALDGLALVVPHWAVQRFVLVAIVAGSGLVAFAACRDRTTGALFAGTLYAINPFVYVRLLAGHWWFLLGYAVMPLAVVAFAASLRDRSRGWRAAGWTTLACAFDPHVAVLLAVAFASVGSVAVLRASQPRSVIGNAGVVGLVSAGLNAYWLFPAIVSVASGASTVADMGSVDALAFSARGTIASNVPLSVAMLFGFWRGGYRLPTELLPAPLVFGLFGVLLFAAIAGALDRDDDSLAPGIALAGVAGFVLALGVSVDATALLFRALSEHVVVFRGMRDSQKFVALLALAYAILGARSVDRAVDGLEWPTFLRRQNSIRKTTLLRSQALARSLASDRLPSKTTILRIVLVAAVVLAPLAYTWPMLGGFAGQLTVTSYPDGWHESNDLVAANPGSGRVLFLPWHGYLSVPWAGGTIANPADAFFDRPVIRSHSIDHAGVESHATTPAHSSVEAILDDPDGEAPLGAALAPVGVEYVVVAKVADYRQHAYLHAQPDMTPVFEDGDLVVFENSAFDRATHPDRWPRSWPAVPWSTLAVGALLSTGTIVYHVRRGSRRSSDGDQRDRP